MKEFQKEEAERLTRLPKTNTMKGTKCDSILS